MDEQEEQINLMKQNDLKSEIFHRFITLYQRLKIDKISEDEMDQIRIYQDAGDENTPDLIQRLENSFEAFELQDLFLNLDNFQKDKLKDYFNYTKLELVLNSLGDFDQFDSEDIPNYSKFNELALSAGRLHICCQSILDENYDFAKLIYKKFMSKIQCKFFDEKIHQSNNEELKNKYKKFIMHR